MACVHNQAKINAIKAEIQRLQNDLTNLRSNISKCNEIKQKHTEFNEKLRCVMDNLSGNYVEAGKTYDGGMMLNCSANAISTIKDCESIILESNKQITLIQSKIRDLNRQIVSLSGDCSSCEAARYAALTLKEKQHH